MYQYFLHPYMRVRGWLAQSVHLNPEDQQTPQDFCFFMAVFDVLNTTWGKNQYSNLYFNDLKWLFPVFPLQCILTNRSPLNIPTHHVSLQPWWSQTQTASALSAPCPPTRRWVSMRLANLLLLFCSRCRGCFNLLDYFPRSSTKSACCDPLLSLSR